MKNNVERIVNRYNLSDAEKAVLSNELCDLFDVMISGSHLQECNVCGVKLKTVQGLRIHQKRLHGIVYEDTSP